MFYTIAQFSSKPIRVLYYYDNIQRYAHEYIKLVCKMYLHFVQGSVLWGGEGQIWQVPYGPEVGTTYKRTYLKIHLYDI